MIHLAFRLQPVVEVVAVCVTALDIPLVGDFADQAMPQVPVQLILHAFGERVGRRFIGRENGHAVRMLRRTVRLGGSGRRCIAPARGDVPARGGRDHVVASIVDER